MNKRTFPASLDHLHEMLQFIRKEVHSSGFTGIHETQIELALEEALVNIIKYGYPTSPGEIHIQCTHLPNQGIKITLTDRGVPFNPCSIHSKTEKLEQTNPYILGGYGIYLIVTIMDHVDYEFQDGCNILHLTKFLP